MLLEQPPVFLTVDLVGDTFIVKIPHESGFGETTYHSSEPIGSVVSFRLNKSITHLELRITPKTSFIKRLYNWIKSCS